MKISTYGHGKKIVLSTALDSRAKILNACYFVAFTAVLWVLLKGLYDEDMGLNTLVLFLLLATLYGIAAYRFVNKALMSEVILIGPENLQLIKSGFLSKKVQSFNPKLIRQLSYLQRPEPPKHPLAGESFDYLGFQTQQQMINELHGDDKISFEYEGKTVSFGEHVYSWDFEEIEKIFKEFIGAGFRFNEAFEAVFKFETDERSEQEGIKTTEL